MFGRFSTVDIYRCAATLACYYYSLVLHCWQYGHSFYCTTRFFKLLIRAVIFDLILLNSVYFLLEYR